MRHVQFCENLSDGNGRTGENDAAVEQVVAAQRHRVVRGSVRDDVPRIQIDEPDARHARGERETLLDADLRPADAVDLVLDRFHYVGARCAGLGSVTMFGSRRRSLVFMIGSPRFWPLPSAMGKRSVSCRTTLCGSGRWVPSLCRHRTIDDLRILSSPRFETDGHYRYSTPNK